MAERRMFAKTIVLSDAFLDMPLSTRCLYFTLGMLADDDGFINSPKSIMRQCGATEDDMKMLIIKKFILPFDSGVIVIKHWRINNYLRSDRKTDTKYLDEMDMLSLDKNGAYSLGIPNAYQMPTTCQSSGIPSIDKDSVDKYSVDKDNKKPVRHQYGEYHNVLLTDEEYQKLQAEYPNDLQERIERLSSYIASTGKSYKSHYATIRNWARNDKEKGKKPQQDYSFDMSEFEQRAEALPVLRGKAEEGV